MSFEPAGGDPLVSHGLASMRRFFAALAWGSPDGHVIEADGVFAAVVPAIPRRSFVNSVVYEDAGKLGAVLDEVAAAYERARVLAWTVWAPEDDRPAAALLERAGHVLDASPRAMALSLDELEAVPVEIDMVRPEGMEAAAALNEAAYGWEPGEAGTSFTGLPGAGAHVYLAHAGERPASCVLALDHEGDCGIYMVATAAEARGRGLATSLMRAALADGRERGCTISTLQATRAGFPVYAALGYRDLGAVNMWERRRPEGRP